MNIHARTVVVALLATFAGASYAKNCTKGQPCGNSCIAWSDTCHIGTTTYTPTPAVSLSPPTASFTQTQTSGVAPLTVSFDGADSYASGAAIARYQWSASNGQSATGKNVDLVFATPGTYTVTLTVTDSNGKTGSSQKTVIATPPPTLTAPAKCAGASYANGKLTLPSLTAPTALNQTAIYAVTMDYVIFSNPSEFILTNAAIAPAASECRTGAYSPSTGIVSIPAVEVTGAGQYNVNLSVIPGVEPMRFQLQSATAK